MADEQTTTTGTATAGTPPAAQPTPQPAPGGEQKTEGGMTDPLEAAGNPDGGSQGGEGGGEGGMPDVLGETGDGKPAEDTGAPEQYTAFRLEDSDVAPEEVQGFTDAAREMGLSQEKAQKMFETLAPAARQYAQKQLVGYANQWREALVSDKEFGGAQFKANLAIAGEGYRRYASEGLRTILKASGLSNHPEVVRHFYRLGKALQQDKGVAGHASAPAAPPKRYPNSNMVEDF